MDLVIRVLRETEIAVVSNHYVINILTAIYDYNLTVTTLLNYSKNIVINFFLNCIKKKKNNL